MKNFLSRNFFLFIAGVVATGDKPLRLIYLRKFSQKLGITPMVYSGTREKMIHEKKPCVKNLGPEARGKMAKKTVVLSQ
jgi:hypothetical protein